MHFESHFSLLLELAKLFPLDPIVEAGGRALMQLGRKIRKSGSDVFIEEDLSNVFGRNRIQPQFESFFRTAVSKSSIVELPILVDIVLEAGAGPTVRRSINNKAYLSTVIQLSLLSYCHNLNSLTKALIKALERRAEGSAELFTEIPERDALLRTLRAIRDQSIGYRWDMVFSAVEK